MQISSVQWIWEVHRRQPDQQWAGTPDVVVKGGLRPRIVIEVETGKSDVVSIVKRDLLEGAEKVIVVATDEGALQKVERQLHSAGLLIPPRVVVVLRDGLNDALGGKEK